MDDLPENTDHRERLIGKIYDVVLNPSSLQEFLSDWDKYVSEAVAPYEALRNSDGPSEQIIRDEQLETHFARAFAILERFNTTSPKRSLTDVENSGDILFCFDNKGGVLKQATVQHSHFDKVRHAKDLAREMDQQAQEAWFKFLTDSRRAPTLDQFHIFSLEDFGNLIAFNHRKDDSSDYQLFVKYLKVHWTPALSQLLSNQFQLSEREVMLVEELSNTGSLETIAHKSERSKHTLRTQMKSVFRKMRVRSQAEVAQSIALLAQLCDAIDQDQVDSQDDVKLGELQEICTKSGAVVPVYSAGPANGRPVIFIHGMLDGVALTDELLRGLYKHKLKFIAPIRPNFGRAGKLADVNDAPHVFAEQLNDVMNQLEIQNGLLLGHMSGSVFSFSAEKYLKNKVLGIINISGGIPIHTAKQFSKQSLRQRAFAYTARYAPAFFPALMKAGVAQIDMHGPESLMLDMHPEGSHDGQVIENPAIAAVIMDGYKFAVAQGYAGFQGDAYHVTRNWHEFIEGTKCPVLLIHGAHDPVVTIDYVADFAHQEGFHLERFDDAGQLVFYEKPDQVLDRISTFFEIVRRDKGVT